MLLSRVFFTKARLLMIACLAALLSLTGGTHAAAQTWSPDNQKIVVAGPVLVQVDVNSLTLQNKPADPFPVSPQGVNIGGSGIWPAWSPDGKILAYLAEGAKLTTLDLATHQTKLVDDRAVSPVAWSPDSHFLGYVRLDEKGSLELRTVHANGDMALAVPLPFTKLATGTTQTIAWVPTTDNVIVAGGDGTKTDLYLIDQGEVVALTSSGDVQGFAVSSDGERVRWVRRSLNTHYILMSIYDLLISKRTALKLDFPSVVPAVNPHPRRSIDAVLSVVFSPDLNRVAFVTRGGPGAGANGVALYVSDVHGRNVQLVGKGQVIPPPPAAPNPQPPDKDQPPPPPAIPAQAAPAVQPAPPANTELTGLTFPALLPCFSPNNRQLSALQLQGEKRYLLVFSIDTRQRSIALLP